MSDEDDETSNLRARLRELKSTFRYDYENEDMDETSSDPPPTPYCPIDHLNRYLTQLGSHKITVIILVLVCVLIVYVILRPAPSPAPNTSVNLILAASKKIKFQL